jgi:hypothetical protein
MTSEDAFLALTLWEQQAPRHALNLDCRQGRYVALAFDERGDAWVEVAEGDDVVTVMIAAASYLSDKPPQSPFYGVPRVTPEQVKRIVEDPAFKPFKSGKEWAAGCRQADLTKEQLIGLSARLWESLVRMREEQAG